MKKMFYMFFLVLLILGSCDTHFHSKNEQLLYISITQKPIKIKYFIGEEFDKTGLCVYAYYSDSSKKVITEFVSISGFDNTKKNGYLPIAVSYTEKEVTKVDTFYVSIDEINLNYPHTDKNRIVQVSFQYFRRNTTLDSFQQYTYSNDLTDDINGSVTFKIDTKKGVSYSVDNLITAYKYYPDNASRSAELYDINEDNIKKTKYIEGNSVSLEETSEGYMPYSFLFTTKASHIGLSVYGSSSVIGGVNSLIFEDILIDAIRSNKHTLFKGTEYPLFETDSNGTVKKATLLKQVNNYFLCLITIETNVQNVTITWPDSLWRIDHLE